MDILSSHVRCRQLHPEGAALTFFTEHFDFATMSLDNIPALVQSDAEAVRLGRLKRPEQAVPDEIFRHTATVISHLKKRRPIFFADFHYDRILF